MTVDGVDSAVSGDGGDCGDSGDSDVLDAVLSLRGGTMRGRLEKIVFTDIN